MTNGLKLYLNHELILRNSLALQTEIQSHNSITHVINKINWHRDVIRWRLFIPLQDYVPSWWSMVFPGVHMTVSQLLHGWLNIFIPYRVNDGIQRGLTNSVEHRKELIHRKSAKRPYVEVNARPKEKNHFCDVSS